MSLEERKELGKKGREHVKKNYSFEKYCDKWVEIMTQVHEKHGSWDEREGYTAWELKELT